VNAEGAEEKQRPTSANRHAAQELVAVALFQQNAAAEKYDGNSVNDERFAGGSEVSCELATARPITAITPSLANQLAPELPNRGDGFMRCSSVGFGGGERSGEIGGDDETRGRR
jgi:hypothetical protein